MAADSSTIIVSTCASIFSAIAVAFANYKFSSQKTMAEIGKLRAETDLLRQQATKIQSETQSLGEKLESGLGNLTKIIYDGGKPDLFDFEGLGVKNWDNKLNAPVGEKAGGKFTIVNDVLNIERTDNHGRFKIVLKKYAGKNSNAEYVSQDVTIGQSRRILISGLVKSQSGASHMLDFIIKIYPDGDWLASQTIKVSSKAWEEVNIALRVRSDRDFIFMIYNHDVESVPSSFQIKNLKLVEKY